MIECGSYQTIYLNPLSALDVFSYHFSGYIASFSTSNLRNAQSKRVKINHPIRGLLLWSSLAVNTSAGHRNNEMSTSLYFGICGSSWWYILWLSAVIGCHYTSDGNWLPIGQSEPSPPLHTSDCFQLQKKNRKATQFI